MTDDLSRADLSRAKSAVFRLLKIRIRSEQEIVEKLKKKDFENTTIKETIEYFKDIDLINDRLFAQQWIRSRLNKPFGLNRIKNELKTKGIHEEILQEEIEKVRSDDYQESEIVLKIAKRRASIYRNIDKMKLKQRLFGYLIRRGFNQDPIYKALKQL